MIHDLIDRINRHRRSIARLEGVNTTDARSLEAYYRQSLKRALSQLAEIQREYKRAREKVA